MENNTIIDKEEISNTTLDYTNTLLLKVVNPQSDICTSFSDLENKIKNKYFIKDRITCTISDFIINDDGTISIQSNNQKYVITEYAIKEFCKFLKIPYSFAKLIHLFLLKTNIDELKLLKDMDVSFIICNPITNFDYDGIIVNVTKNLSNTSDYINDLLNILSDENFMNSKNIKFFNSIVSHSGFQINVLSTKNDFYNAKLNNNESHIWRFGNSLLGDFYGMNKKLQMNLLCYNETSNLYYTTNERVHAPEYNVISKRVIEMGDEYTQSLIENIKEDIGIGMNPKTLQEVIDYSINHDISFYRFSKTYSTLKKIFNKEYAYNLLMSEFEDVQRIESDQESIIEHTRKPEISKRLQTMGIEKCNSYIIFQNILSTVNEVGYDEILLLNDIAKEIIFDTFECSVETPKRIADGVVLK
jgi:hypothetical protein